MTNSFDERFGRLLTAMDELAGAGASRQREDPSTSTARAGVDPLGVRGMGSLNDVVIGTAGGHPIGTDEVDDANRELERLRATAYHEASALLRELGEQR